jgi:putative N6-adenine-specific DNA methylase
VIAPVHEFFAATAPGLEALCRQELLALELSVPDAAIVPGGVTFSGKLVDLYRANLHLRTANRILMRIASFSATNFRQLERRLAEVDWSLFLPDRKPVRVRTSTRGCRLYHSEAVAQRVKMCLERVLGVPDRVPEAPGLGVFVRCESDRFTVSVDSSGELLHRRGLKTHPASAPIRETLAAAVLNWAGFDPVEPMIDPMCGSGTFSLEAALISLKIPPGWYRRFAFESWPAFRPQQWRHVRREAEGRIGARGKMGIFAGDRDLAALSDLRRCLNTHGLDRAVALFAGDFFDLRPEKIAAGPGLVVLNPPYGRRLNTDAEGGVFMTQVAVHLARAFGGWKFALVAPPRQLGAIALPHRSRRLVHGGLKLHLVTGRIPPPG